MSPFYILYYLAFQCNSLEVSSQLIVGASAQLSAAFITEI